VVEIPNNVVPIETGKVLKKTNFTKERSTDEARKRERRLIECLTIALQLIREPDPPSHS
jgi:hypothetical protein